MRNENRLPSVQQIHQEKAEAVDEFASYFEEYNTEFVPLATEGKLYPEGHSLRSGEIELRYPDTNSQTILQNKSYIKKGIVYEKFLQSLVVDKGIKIGDVYASDIASMLIHTRVLMFGNDFRTTVRCPVCNGQNKVTIDLSEQHFSMRAEKELEAENIKRNGEEFEIVLSNGLKVVYKLLLGKEQNYLTQISSKKKKNSLQHDPIKDLFNVVVKKVLTEEGKEMPLHVFLDRAPLKLTSQVIMAYNFSEPNTDITSDFTCEHCFNYEEDLVIPLTVNFFRPKL